MLELPVSPCLLSVSFHMFREVPTFSFFFFPTDCMPKAFVTYQWLLFWHLKRWCDRNHCFHDSILQNSHIFVVCNLMNSVAGVFLHTAEKNDKAAVWEGMYREEEVGGRKWSNRSRAHTQNILIINKKKKETNTRTYKERTIKNQVIK